MSAAIVTHSYPENPGDLLGYNPDNGEMFWKPSHDMGAAWNARFANRRAGYLLKGRDGNPRYWYIKLSGIAYPAHRVIWVLYHGTMQPGEIDHINGDGLDNRISNLRCVSHSENSKNTTIRHTNRSGVPGVVWNERDNRWGVSVRIDGVQTSLGMFSDYFEAVCARKSAEIACGYHANHGRKNEKQGVYSERKLSMSDVCLAKKPKPYTCQVCNSEFTSVDTRARYCSNRCKQQAAGARRKARITSARRSPSDTPSNDPPDTF